jgi:hypothetical protein
MAMKTSIALRSLVLLTVSLAINRPVLASKLEDSCKALIPPDLANEIKARNSGWKIVDLSSLIEDDRMLWVKKHGKVCPGVAKGNFDASKRSQYALVLMRQQPQPEVKLLHAVKGEQAKYRLTLLAESPVTRAPVVFRAPPGNYYDAEDPRTPIKIKTDVIIFETIEAGATAFYFVDGKPRQLEISI